MATSIDQLHRSRQHGRCEAAKLFGIMQGATGTVGQFRQDGDTGYDRDYPGANGAATVADKRERIKHKFYLSILRSMRY